MGRIDQENVGRIAVLTISNQKKRNALTGAMATELADRLEQISRSATIRAVVLTGAGDTAFCSGHDLNELAEDLSAAADEARSAPLLSPMRCSKPVIAAVNGAAYAGGLILSMACDLRVCSVNARFAAPAARLGMFPIGGQMARLTSFLPLGVAVDLLMTSRELCASEAHAFGFAKEVVPLGKARHAAIERAELLCTQSPRALAELKRGFRVLEQQGQDAAVAFEWAAAARLLATTDPAEGVAAFLERRSATFD